MSYKNLKKVILPILIAISLIIPVVSHASIFDFIKNIFQKENVNIAAPTETNQRNIYPFEDSTYEIGTSSRAFLRGTFDELCLTGDSCETTWPIGGGSGATTTINGVTGPNFLFNSSSSALTYSTSTGTVTLNLSTSTLQSLLTGTSTQLWSVNGSNIYNSVGNTVSIGSSTAVRTLSVVGNANFGIIGAPLATSTPINVSFGSTYGNSTPGSVNNLKWDLYTSNTSGVRYGIGMSSGLMEFQAGTSGALGFFVNGGTEAMRILSNGNIGIGTTTPSAPFVVAKTGSANAAIFETDTAGSQILVQRTIRSGNNQPASFQFRGTNGVGNYQQSQFLGGFGGSPNFVMNPGLTIKSGTSALGTGSDVFNVDSTSAWYNSGNFGIGTTTPSSKLDVWGNLNVGTSSTPVLFANSATGFVGFGTANPTNPLHIISPSSGSLAALKLNDAGTGIWTDFNDGGSNRLFRIERFNNGARLSTWSGGSSNITLAPGNPNSIVVAQGTTTQIADIFQVRNGNNTVLFNVASSTNVGISSSTPSAKLTVKGDGSTTGRLINFTDSNNLSRFFVTDGGNMGVNTASPASTLHINGYSGAADFRITAFSDTLKSFKLEISNEDAFIKAPSDYGNGTLAFWTNNTEKAKITAGGNFGVGTSTAGAKIHAVATTEQLRLGYSATQYSSFLTGSTGKLNITNTGNGVGINSSSPGGQFEVIPSASTTIASVFKGATSQTGDLTQWQNSASSILARVTSGGSILSNQTFDANNPVQVGGSNSSTVNGAIAFGGRFSQDSGSAVALSRSIGGYFEANGYASTTGYADGVEGRSFGRGNGTITATINGLDFRAYHIGGASSTNTLTINNANAIQATVGFYSGTQYGNIVNARGIYLPNLGQGHTGNSGNELVNNLYGIHIAPVGSDTSFYGIYIDTPTYNPATSYGLYIAGGTNNYLKGLTGINTISPGAQLHVQTSSSSTKALLLRATSGQTANMLEILNSAGTIISSFNSNGDLYISSSTADRLAYFNGSKILASVTLGTGLTLSGGTLSLDSDLSTIAGLSPSNDDIIQFKSGAWTNRTMAQLKTDLSLNNVENTALSTWAGSANLTTLGTITSGTWNGSAIDISSYTNLAAGRSLTLSGDSLEADTELYTDIKSATLISPTTTDDGLVQLKFPTAVTITRISCSTNSGSSTIQFDERAEATPDTSGTDVMTSALVCDTDNEATTSFTNASIAANAPMSLDVDAIGGTPGVLRISVEYTKDD